MGIRSEHHFLVKALSHLGSVPNNVITDYWGLDYSYVSSTEHSTELLLILKKQWGLLCQITQEAAESVLPGDN